MKIEVLKCKFLFVPSIFLKKNYKQIICILTVLFDSEHDKIRIQTWKIWKRNQRHTLKKYWSHVYEKGEAVTELAL